MQRSPTSIPLQPRIIYVSSSRAAPEFLPQPDPTSDPQLLTTRESYDASKYMGDLVVSELDREFAGDAKRSVRCLVVDPGVVWTSLFTPFLPWILEMCMVAAFFLVSAIERTCLTTSTKRPSLGTMDRLDGSHHLSRHRCRRAMLPHARRRCHPAVSHAFYTTCQIPSQRGSSRSSVRCSTRCQGMAEVSQCSAGVCRRMRTGLSQESRGAGRGRRSQGARSGRQNELN